jgi:hypothetical protein
MKYMRHRLVDFTWQDLEARLANEFVSESDKVLVEAEMNRRIEDNRMIAQELIPISMQQ